MNEQVLSIEQMKHLKELGVDTSGASMKFISIYPSCDYNEDDERQFVPVDVNFHAKRYNEGGRTFTLQDMFNIMPKHLKIKVESYRTPVDCLLMVDVANDCVYYECFVWQQYDRAKYFDGANLISSAYKMFCWLAENDYLNKK